MAGWRGAAAATRAIIGLLDGIKKAGLAEVEVKDDGGFWKHRDPEALAETARLWNGVV